MNIYSFVLIAILFYCLFSSKKFHEFYLKLLMVTLINECFIELGYFIKIGSNEIAYRTVCETVLLFCSIIMLCMCRMKLSNLIRAFFLITICLFGIIHLILQPSNILASNIDVSWDAYLTQGQSFETIHFIPSYMLLELFQMVCFVITVLTVYSNYSYEELKAFLLRFAGWSKYMLVIGCIEAVTKYAFRSDLYNMFCNSFFGVAESTESILASRGSGMILQGLTKEGSHYIYVLFAIIIVIFAEYHVKREKSSKKWLLATIILAALSMSFSALLFAFGALVIAYFYWIKQSGEAQNKFLKKILLGVLILATTYGGLYFVTIGVNYLSINPNDFWSRRIVSAINEIRLIISGSWQSSTTTLEWSNRARLLSSFETLRLIIYRPLLGFGVGAVTSHGSSTMLLADFGIVGTLLWLKYVFGGVLNGSPLEKLKRSGYLVAVLIWFSVNLLNSMALRPFYEITTLMIMIAFRILFGEKSNGKEAETDQVRLCSPTLQKYGGYIRMR